MIVDSHLYSMSHGYIPSWWSSSNSYGFRIHFLVLVQSVKSEYFIFTCQVSKYCPQYTISFLAELPLFSLRLVSTEDVDVDESEKLRAELAAVEEAKSDRLEFFEPQIGKYGKMTIPYWKMILVAIGKTLYIIFCHNWKVILVRKSQKMIIVCWLAQIDQEL